MGSVSPPGSAACQAAAHEELILVLSGSIDTFQAGSPRREQVMSSISQTVDVPQNQIVIVSVTSGSVILELAFLSHWTSPLWPFEVLYFKTPPNEALSRLQSAATEGKFEGLGLNQLKVGGKSVYSNETKVSSTVIIASVSAAVAFLLMLAGLVLWWKKYRAAGQVSDSGQFGGKHSTPQSSKLTVSVEGNTSRTGAPRRESLTVQASLVDAQESNTFQQFDPSEFSETHDIAPGVQQATMNGADVVIRRVSAHVRHPIERAAKLSEIVHPNFTQILGYTCGNDVAVVERGPVRANLFEYLCTKREIAKSRRYSLLVQICSAVQHIHSMKPPVVHAGIRSSHVLLASDCQSAKLSAAGAIDPEITALSIAYVAPELLSGTAEASLESDMYSVGIVLFEVLTGEVAWHGVAPSQVSACVLNGQRPVFPPGVPPAFKRIVCECWAQDPGKRMTAAAAWLQLYVLQSKELGENNPLRLFPDGFQASFVNVQDCLRSALPRRVFDSVMLDVPIIDEYLTTLEGSHQVRMHGLSEIEAKCLMLYSHDTCNIAALPLHMAFMESKKPMQVRTVYGAACCNSNAIAISHFEHFSFFLLSALQKLPDVAQGSSSTFYAAFNSRLRGMHDAYSVQGAVVCWHFLKSVHTHREAAYADLDPESGGTICEICGFSEVTDLSPLSVPKLFVRERYAKRCIVAFCRYKHNKISRAMYMLSLRRWRVFLYNNGTNNASTCRLVAQHNSSFKVEAALTWEQAGQCGVLLPERVDLVVLSAILNPLPPSAMLSSTKRQGLIQAPRNEGNLKDFFRKPKAEYNV